MILDRHHMDLQKARILTVLRGWLGNTGRFKRVKHWVHNFLLFFLFGQLV